VDPDPINPYLDTDPVPAFQVNPDPNPTPIWGFDVQNLKKRKTAEKFFGSFLIKNCNLLIPSLHKGRPSYRRSLQPSKENMQHFKT
jgi:hypothetical protein